MSDYAIAHLDEIEEVTDGRCPWRPVAHLGITFTLRMPDGMLRALAAAPGSSPLKLAAVLQAAAT